jgi:hypothetical protein
MPSIITRGAGSATAFGWVSSLGAKYFIATLSSVNLDSISNVVTDSTGNIYVGGLESSIGTSFYELSPSGATLLKKTQSFATGGTIRTPIILDTSGNVYMTGGVTGASYGWAVAKFNSAGTEQWEMSESVTGAGSHGVHGVSFSSAGNLLAFGTYMTSTFPGDASLHITSFSASTGTATNVFDFQPTGSYAYGYAIATDSSGNIYVTGEDEGNTGNAIVIKLNSSYTSQWSISFGPTSAYAFPFGVAVNSTGDVYVSGVTVNKAFIAKLSSTGTLTWCRTLSTLGGGTSGFLSSGAVAVDTDGSVYFVATGFSGATYNNVIAKYSSAGAIQWQRTVLPASGNTVKLVGISLTSDAVCVSGYDTSTYNGVLLKIPKDGSRTGTVSPGGVTWSYSASSYTDAASGYSAASITGSSAHSQSYSSSSSSNVSSTTTITATQI